jgi:hypothetical protein
MGLLFQRRTAIIHSISYPCFAKGMPGAGFERHGTKTRFQELPKSNWGFSPKTSGKSKKDFEVAK